VSQPPSVAPSHQPHHRREVAHAVRQRPPLKSQAAPPRSEAPGFRQSARLSPLVATQHPPIRGCPRSSLAGSARELTIIGAVSSPAASDPCEGDGGPSSAPSPLFHLKHARDERRGISRSDACPSLPHSSSWLPSGEARPQRTFGLTRRGRNPSHNSGEETGAAFLLRRRPRAKR
jgi:hypothetical protein